MARAATAAVGRRVVQPIARSKAAGPSAALAFAHRSSNMNPVNGMAPAKEWSSRKWYGARLCEGVVRDE